MKKSRPIHELESVWDYPRPPKLERTGRHLKVVLDDTTIAETERGWRVLETSHPPVYYFPPEDVRMDLLERSEGSSFCEWKGRAGYYDLITADRRIERAAWFYPEPTARFSDLRDHIAFYPSKMDACFVDGEPVRAQEGDFYGGWITSDIVGPFKGGPGTLGW